MNTLLLSLLLFAAPAIAQNPPCGADPRCAVVADISETVPLADAAQEADEDKEPEADPITGWFSSIGDTLSGLGDTLNAIEERFVPTDAERAAALHVQAMLASNKLGGEDRVFNQADIDRIADALLRDPVVQQQIRDGIREEAFSVADETLPLFRGIARNVANRRTTPGTLAYNRHYQKYWCEGLATARDRITTQLSDALSANDIQAADGTPVSTVGREVTLAEVEQFNTAITTLLAYADRARGDIQLPLNANTGLSQSFIDKVIVLMGNAPR